jgi:hypothetical protein
MNIHAHSAGGALTDYVLIGVCRNRCGYGGSIRFGKQQAMALQRFLLYNIFALLKYSQL